MHRKQAIHMMCKECIYDPTEPGTYVKQAEMCEITSCPLYPFRPRQRSQNKQPKSVQNEQEV